MTRGDLQRQLKTPRNASDVMGLRRRCTRDARLGGVREPSNLALSRAGSREDDVPFPFLPTQH